MTPKPTPTPWIVAADNFGNIEVNSRERLENGGKYLVCSMSDSISVEERSINAAFIVLAVNCHEELMSVLKRTLKHLPIGSVALREVKLAIAKAEGQS